MPDFTTLADVKGWLGLTVTTDDTLLARLITGATMCMISLMDRDPMTASFTEWRNGPGGQAISTRNYPITTVAGVSVDGVAIPASPDPRSAGYTFSDNQIILRGYKFTRDLRNVQLQYTAGLTSVPADLSQACIDLVAFKYRGRNWTGQSSKIMQGETVFFRVEDMPKEIVPILNQYQRVIPV